MARTGSSSKFVPVNLNNSYGQTVPFSNGGTNSSGLGRSRSFSNSYGGMVSLSRPSRAASSSSSSATVSRTSKLAVPRPVNLPSLRREHSGNDPTIALVGSLGSSGWNKQSGDDIVDVNATRSDALKGDATTWGNRTSAPDNSSQGADRRLLSGGRQSPYGASSLGEVPNYAAPAAPAPVAKAVVFRGEDFPLLQAAAAPPSPSIRPMPRTRDSQQKQQDKHPGSTYEVSTHQNLGDDPRESNRILDRQLQPAQPVRMHARSTFLGQVDDDNVDRVSTYPRGPSPLIKLTQTSNWADDERETLSNVRTQESAQDSDWNERNDGFHTVGNWSLDRNADIDFRRPTSRVGYPGRNEPAFSTRSTPASKFVYVKDGDLRRDHLDGGRFENYSRGDLERSSNNFGRNDVLKRGWSFPAGADYNVNREMRYASPNNRVDQDGYSNGKAYLRDGNNGRHDGLGRDIFPQDARPGLQHQDGGQWHDSKFGKDVFLGRQGFPGSVTASGPRVSRGTGSSFSTSDAKIQSGMDYKREKKRVSGFYGQVHDDPFLGDGISSRPPPFYVSQQKMKKESLGSDDYRDPARESFEAELERVEKMLEQERQRAIEERDRAIEIARKEQEEQERIAREEEELRLKLEEEAREAAYRAQKEAEEATRKVEEARRVREEEKRMADVEEERRKEAARRKLLELEERMAKRDLEKREEEVSPKERASATRTVTTDVTMDRQEGGMWKNEINRIPHWKLLSSSGKVDQDSEQVLSKAPVLGSTPLPSILRSPRLSPLAKEENGFSIERGRIAQSWKRDTSISGYEPRPAQKGPPKFLHLRTDRSQQESEDQQRGPFLTNGSAQKSPVRLNESRAPDDADERDWWVRDTNRSISTYPQCSDFSEYPPYGRVRQSLPRQPRVLPPPPGNAMSRKQIFQADEPQSESLVSGTKYAVGPPSNEENRSSAGGESAGAVNQDASAHVSNLFEAVPSEEMVLSDAGSQFSDDTVEDVVVQPEQEHEPHSDVVSETYSDREVDEISDFTEAQESSEDGEPQKAADWEVCQGDQNQERLVRCLEEVRAEALGSLQGQPEVEKDGLIACSEIKDEDLDRHIAQNAQSSSLIEDAASRSLEGPVHAVSVSEQVDKQTTVLTTELQDGQEAVRKAEELTSEKPVQDQELHPFINQASFLSVGTSDVTQIRHLEGLSSRQSLVQQFQQPFSFMAVPLPQSGSLNHVGASLPMLSSVHTLSNQQELPFHVQLGLLPSVPLLPNAIQIGSIQMPLHIHPQLPQLTHLHGHQQAPIFQFGQIGPSLALSQPISTTQLSSPPVQVLNAPGQNLSLQHSESQAEIVVAVDTNINSADCIVRGILDNAACVEGTSVASAGHGFVQNEHTEMSPGASGNSIGSTITAERETELSFVKPKLEKAATDTTSKLDAQAGEKILANDKLESTWVGDIGEFDNNARLSGRHVRGGRRRSNLRYQGILGRGRGRFHGRGHQYPYQTFQGGMESWPEGGTKRFSRGKVYRRNYRRAEYRVREPTPLFDPDTAALNSASGPSLNIDDTKDGGGYRYVKRGLGGHPSNSGDENGPLGGAVPHSSSQVTANAPLVSQSTATATRKSKSMLKKYEVENAEDAPFRTGVVRVFEQPGIETPNDKDDFIKVRSKRQLLRELREQREKENKSKAQDAGSKEPAGKKQQRSSAKIGAINGTTSTKIGASNGTTLTNFSKNIGKRQSTCSDRKLNTPSLPNGMIATSSATSTKRSLTPSKAGRVTSSFRTVSVESESLTGYGDDIHASEHLTTAAWGGQRSNQEVVSLTQIQLEEAMKPFRLDVPFSESMHSPERAVSTLEPVLPCSSSLSAEKIVTSVKASGPLSSLLAGEKIQFGAVTSPTLIPPDNCSAAPVPAVRTGSPTNFGSDPPHISSHSNKFVTGYLDSHLDPTYSLKGGSERKDDGYEAKVIDFEAEAAAEAAASAVVAAAINSEDLIDSHPDTRVSEINVGCNSISSGSSAASAMTGHIQHASDNPIAVALPADLSVETPPSLFQASTMTLPNSSGVLLQSLQGGAPTFPCLEMGPLIGGPVFNFGPREDASMASMEPGLSGWQQRHVGAPDSYYGAPPFLGPAGLSGIQGHPHMLVYTNPYTPVGQFGQLGVSFMGATYHPSGKQPDWSHVPIPSASSGALVMNDGDLSVGSNGIMASQHHNGASNLMQAHRAPVAGSSMMSVATPPNLFDTGFAAPFQVPQMDALVQSHWSKAPAPPVHSVPAPGSTLPLSRPALDFNIQVHPPKVFSSQGGHRANPIDGASAFRQLSTMNPATAGSSFSSPGDACAQFPDELGLGDSLPTATNMQSGAIGPLSDADHSGKTVPIESPRLRVPCGRRSTQSSQGHLNNANSGGLISNLSYPEQSRGGLVAIDSHTKSVGRIGFPGMRNTAVQLLEQRTSKQSLPRDSAGGEWNRGSLRKGASGRLSNAERAGSSVPSKMRQIYVAKPAGDSRKLSAACS